MILFYHNMATIINFKSSIINQIDHVLLSIPRTGFNRLIVALTITEAAVTSKLLKLTEAAVGSIERRSTPSLATAALFDCTPIVTPKLARTVGFE